MCVQRLWSTDGARGVPHTASALLQHEHRISSAPCQTGSGRKDRWISTLLTWSVVGLSKAANATQKAGGSDGRLGGEETGDSGDVARHDFADKAAFPVSPGRTCIG